jgi:proteasome assembly chaperone (PAC2) family protein
MDRRKKVIEAAEKALVELEKVIKQKIDLAELDPAIEDSFKIIDKIEQVHDTKKETEKESIKFLGVENRVK